MGPGASESYPQDQQVDTDVKTEARLYSQYVAEQMFATLEWLSPEPVQHTQLLIQGRQTQPGSCTSCFEGRVPPMKTEGFPGVWRPAIAPQSCMCLCSEESVHTFHQIVRGDQKTG